MIAGAASRITQAGIKNIALPACELHGTTCATPVRQWSIITPADRSPAFESIATGAVTQAVLELSTTVAVLTKLSRLHLKLGNHTCASAVAVLFQPANRPNSFVTIPAGFVAQPTVLILATPTDQFSRSAHTSTIRLANPVKIVSRLGKC